MQHATPRITPIGANLPFTPLVLVEPGDDAFAYAAFTRPTVIPDTLRAHVGAREFGSFDEAFGTAPASQVVAATVHRWRARDDAALAPIAELSGQGDDDRRIQRLALLAAGLILAWIVIGVVVAWLAGRL